jgi:hypothetical protein
MTGTVCELLERCRAAGLELLVEGDMLHVEFEREPPTALLEEIRRRKPEVMAALSSALIRGEVSGVAPPPATEPLVLRDGRVMHRFHAAEIPARAALDVVMSLDKVRRVGVVLVADGMELHVVERWKGQLHPQTLRNLRDNAGAVITVLRGEHRARIAELPAEQVAEYDPRRPRR